MWVTLGDGSNKLVCLGMDYSETVKEATKAEYAKLKSAYPYKFEAKKKQNEGGTGDK